MRANTKERVLHALMFVILIFLVLGVVLFNVIFSGINYASVLLGSDTLQEDTGVDNATGVTEPENAYHAMTIHFLGNCIVGSILGSDGYGTFNAMAQETEPAYFFEKNLRLFANDDWTIGLLGTVLSDNGELAPVTDGIAYKGTASQAEILTAGGVDIVSLATLHTRDYGSEGYADTVAAVEAAGLQWGDDEHAVYLEKEDVQIGIYLCSVGASSMDDSTDRIVNWINGAVEKCDMVVIYLSDRGVEIESEWWPPLGQACIDAGASIVLCNREIGPMSVEAYKDGVIIDCLGTFLDGGERYGEKENFVYALTVYLKDGTVSDWEGEMLPFYNYEEPWQPVQVTE
ncbi:MAG: CapA family protein [Clostridia bacterium]|nr:CapA family protein [Clostridia bacterium]